ncbi:MAG: hypothetical protein HQK59_16050, partial [Deltaproteobacteria bacterium]|nr:hypothetical protein [Deltaproteobacteria bacterium]
MPTEPTFKYVPGKDPELDAYVTNFLTENHLDYIAFLDKVAPPEQVRFMVALKDDEFYYPCSDRMFECLVFGKDPDYVRHRYQQVKDRIDQLISDRITDPFKRRFFRALI